MAGKEKKIEIKIDTDEKADRLEEKPIKKNVIGFKWVIKNNVKHDAKRYNKGDEFTDESLKEYFKEHGFIEKRIDIN